MKKVFLISILILFSLFLYMYLSYPNFDKIKTELRFKYKDFSKGDDSDVLTYKGDVLYEDKINLSFPQEEVKSAKIFEKFYSFPKKINNEEISFLIKKLNDSSSFIWGEIGTFIHYKTVIFYNENDEIIGLTEIDEDLAQTYSVPMTKKMKWGYLVLSDNNDSKYYKNIVN